MNKLFKKIVGAALGLTMAIGVGVAIGSNTKADRVEAAVWEKATSISVGDTVILVCESVKKELTGISTTSTKYGIGTSYSTSPAGSYPLTVTAGSASGKFSFKTGSNYLRWSSGNSLDALGTSVAANTSWTVTFNASGNALIANVNDSAREIWWNDSSPRFACYTGKTESTTGYSAVQIYKQATSYTISYNSNGGSGTMSSTTGTNPAVAACTFNAPTGKHFDHWNTSATDDGTTYAVGATPKKNLPLYAIWATNSYTVGGTITNGSLSSTANVNHGSPLNISINPDSGHKLPTTLTSVEMGGSAYAGYTYNSGTGAFSIASVTGNVVINATCPVDATTHSISGTITNGSLSGDTGEQVEGGNYTVQISPTALHKYPASISISGAGVEGTGWSYSSGSGVVSINNLSADVTITATCGDASITSISVTGQKAAFTLGEEFLFNGTVKASYDDVAGSTNVTISTDLVDIDSSGYNPFVEANSEKATKYYTIDVALKADATVNTSYNVTVTKKTITTTTTYVKVTASQSNWSGKYVFMNANNGHVMGTTIASDRVANGTLSDLKNPSGNTIGSSDTVIASGYTNYVYTITKVGDYYTISPDAGTNAGKFLAATGVKNKAQYLANSDTSDYRLWTISYSSGFVITNKYNAAQSINAVLRCNDNSGWAAYGATQATNGAPCLFAKTDTPSGVRSLIQLTATGPAAEEKVEEDILSVSDFTATALFDTAESATVTPTIVSVNDKAPSTPLSVGSNVVVLSYTDPNDALNTKECEVTVIAAENTAELDGITWNKEGTEFIQFEGTTIEFGSLHKHYDDDSTVVLDVSDCTVAVYTKSGLVFTKDHDIANPSTYVFSLNNDDGKYLGVTYESYTLYSGKLSVVETIGTVIGKVETTLFDEQATSDNPVEVGDIVTLVSKGNDRNMESSSKGSSIVIAEAYTGSYPTGKMYFTVGSDGNGKYTLHNEDNGYAYYDKLASSKNNELYFTNSIDDENYTTSWDIAFDEDDNAIITSVYTLSDGESSTDRTIRYNYNNGANPRFCCYTSGQTDIQLYKGRSAYIPDPEGSDIANTNAVVQKAVLEYAIHFNETMNCVQAGTTTNVSGKWTTLSGDFDDLLAEFTGSDLAHCKALFAGADAVDGGDTLQDMLARYEYICGKYKLDDFLADVDRPPVPQRIDGLTPFATVVGENGSTVLIITIISVVSAAAIGGYFLLRKKKEI